MSILTTEYVPNGKPAEALEVLRAAGEAGLFGTELANAIGVRTNNTYQTLRPLRDNGLVHERREGKRIRYWAAEAKSPPEPSTFEANRWSDGDVDLYGVEELEGGGVRISAKDVRKLLVLLGAVA